ncbi:MAG TPA: dienelactone hydrolase family protein [Caulobacteraceae bacterium]|jgi:carboxymethylenebutenolidase|nr:dienelactone hydrolase family protein [Caulobacteraceae bacterium]
MNQHHLTRADVSQPEDFHLSRRGVAALMFAGYTLAAGPIRAETITTDTKGLFASAITIPSHGFNLPGYIAMPQDARHTPVVVVISEVFGLHEYIRDVCRRLAHAGYVAIAPDFFARAGNPATLTMDQRAEIFRIVATATDKQVMGDINATLDYIASKPALGQKHPDFADMNRVGITGFCWGGGVTWMAMIEVPRIKTGVAWYGQLFPGNPRSAEDRKYPVEEVDKIHGPVLGLYAGLDKGFTPDQVEAMRKALKAKGDTRSELIEYPDAQHGFHADYRATYNEKDAKDGWARLLAWFDKYLRH